MTSIKLLLRLRKHRCLKWEYMPESLFYRCLMSRHKYYLGGQFSDFTGQFQQLGCPGKWHRASFILLEALCNLVVSVKELWGSLFLLRVGMRGGKWDVFYWHSRGGTCLEVDNCIGCGLLWGDPVQSGWTVRLQYNQNLAGGAGSSCIVCLEVLAASAINSGLGGHCGSAKWAQHQAWPVRLPETGLRGSWVPKLPCWSPSRAALPEGSTYSRLSVKQLEIFLDEKQDNCWHLRGALVSQA